MRLRSVDPERLDLAALIGAAGRAHAVRPLRLPAIRADVDARRADRVRCAALVAARLGGFPLRDCHDRRGMVPETILEQFDRQMRQQPTDEDGLYVSDGWTAVLWPGPDFDRAGGRLRAAAGCAEWKLYGHDPPALAERLRAAGFEAEDEEVVMVAEAASLQPTHEDVRVCDTPALVESFGRLTERAFGEPSPAIQRELLRSLEQETPSTLAVIAFVGGEPASGGRIDFSPNADFAGLFGGGTVPEQRGRGLYRATVAKRAELARERGYRWLYVDALPTSRPILERLGFVQLTTTTPYGGESRHRVRPRHRDPERARRARPGGGGDQRRRRQPCRGDVRRGTRAG